MNLDFDVKDRVKQATDIVDLIGSHLNLRRQGASYVGHCPWHDDTRPSFQVNPAKQTWACWPCDIRGDVFDFCNTCSSLDDIIAVSDGGASPQTLSAYRFT